MLQFSPTDGANAYLNFDVTGALTDGTIYYQVPVALRAGTVPANLATLAMTGVPSGKDGAAGTNGVLSAVEVIKTTAYTVLAADTGKTIIANSGSAIGFAMSAAATLGSTFEILVKNIGAGTLTITPNGAETIDGAATATLLTGQSALVSSNGTALRTFKGAGGLAPASNLSDVASAATSRGNLGAFGVVRTQVFTSSGTYTPNANMLYCIIECVGGGGGGGGAAITTAGTINGGGGGGGGSYARLLATAAAIGASKTVTIGAAGGSAAAGANNGGAGGDTSVGTLCIGKGGAGGSGAAAGGGASGGAGGVAGTGDVTVVGSAGTQGFRSTNAVDVFAIFSGGNSGLNFGTGGIYVVGNAGAAGVGYGAGGAGGSDYSNSGNKTGGAGTAGIVIIKEFCSA